MTISKPAGRTQGDLNPRRLLGAAVRKGVGMLGYRLTPAGSPLSPDFDPELAALIDRVQPYTVTSPERIFALREAVRYIERAAIPGAIVECGVWKGGSMLAALLTLQELGSTDRGLYLYDTFEGMSEPGPLDVDIDGNSGKALFSDGTADPSAILPSAPLDGVKSLLEGTGYPAGRITYVVGDVADTLPAQAPGPIALLRLDTDWYESTLAELEHLYPLIADGGVLILDDYGHWQGARKAVDEYFDRNKIHLLLHRVDYTCRVAVVRR